MSLQKYYADENKRIRGDHLVHAEDCAILPPPERRMYLGEFLDCTAALVEAKKLFNRINGCEICCNECHKK